MKFVDVINSHDVAGLVAMMTKDHVFIDSLGLKATRPSIEVGWKEYLAMVPDYQVRVESAFSEGDISILVGEAGGTYVPPGRPLKPENKWSAPAVWVAKVRGDRIAEWRVYSDNEPIREKMRQRQR